MNDEMEQRLKELLIYMTVCAAGLRKEPPIYGSLRLIESARLLAEILKENVCDDPLLDEFIELIDEGKYKSMTDVGEFYDMVQDSVLMLIDL